jgi:hypothetical protein
MPQVLDWLDENTPDWQRKSNTKMAFATRMNGSRRKYFITTLAIIFQTIEHAIAFKLRWSCYCT